MAVLAGLTGLLQSMALPLSLAAAAGAVASLVMRWRAAGQRGRQALQHVMGAIAVFVAVVVLAGLVPLPLTISATVQILAALLIPAAIVVGVLQRQLFDIRLVVRPSLVYTSLTISILVLYIVVVQLVSQLGGHDFGLVAATGVVALAFQPLHRRLQQGVDRLLHGDRADPGAAVTRLVSRLSSSSEPGAVLAGVAAAVAESLQVPGVRAAVVDGERVMGDAIWGEFPTAVEHVPIRFYDNEVGYLELAERAPEARSTAPTVGCSSGCARTSPSPCTSCRSPRVSPWRVSRRSWLGRKSAAASVAISTTGSGPCWLVSGSVSKVPAT